MKNVTSPPHLTITQPFSECSLPSSIPHLGTFSDSLQPQCTLPILSKIETITTLRTRIHRKQPVSEYRNLKLVNTYSPSSDHPPPTAFKMALLNIRSLLNKAWIINDFISENKIDCLFLTETWLSTDAPFTLIEATPPSFHFTYSIRTDRRGGGTAIILSSSYNFKDIMFGSYKSFEYQSIILKSQKILCLLLYRPPGQCSFFLSEFSELLSVVHIEYENIIILCDFNVHVDNPSNVFAAEFFYVLNCMNFHQHVHVPTHNKGHTLDLIIMARSIRY